MTIAFISIFHCFDISGSAIFFDNNMFYPNFLSQISVNNTIPLFGPRSWRIDDYNDPANWLREPTNNTVSNACNKQR